MNARKKWITGVLAVVVVTLFIQFPAETVKAEKTLQEMDGVQPNVKKTEIDDKHGSEDTDANVHLSTNKDICEYQVESETSLTEDIDEKEEC